MNFWKKLFWKLVDHNVPTLNQHLEIKDELSRNQVEKLKLNCIENNIELDPTSHGFFILVNSRELPLSNTKVVFG